MPNNPLQIWQLAQVISSPQQLCKLATKWKQQYICYLHDTLQGRLIHGSDIHHFYSTLPKTILNDWVSNPLVANAILNKSEPIELADEVLSRLIEVLFYNNMLGNDVVPNAVKVDYRLKIHGIPLNVGNGSLFDSIDPCYGLLVAPTAIADSLKKIASTLLKLKHLDPTIFNVITQHNILLALRNDNVSNDAYSSVSFSRYPGLTLVTNVQHSNVSGYKLIDSLYHEAIHAIIYYYEELTTTLLLESYDREIKVVSPWSGNDLDLNQFVQAIFVWTGLLNLWNNIEEYRTDGEIVKFKNKALKGLKADPVASFLEGGGAIYCKTDTLTALKELQALHCTL